MSWKRYPSVLIIVIAVLFMTTIACQSVTRILYPHDLEATIQAGMVATRQAEDVPKEAPTQTKPAETFPTQTQKLTSTASLTPSSIPTQSPTVTYSLTPSITPSITPSPNPIRELPLNHLMGLGLYYDSSIWQPTEDGIGRALLESREIPHCTIQEQGPTEPPPINDQFQIGPIVYDVAQFESNTEQGDLYISWHLARSGFENPLPGTIPVLIVISALEDADACLSDAYPVLETLHPTNQ